MSFTRSSISKLSHDSNKLLTTYCHQCQSTLTSQSRRLASNVATQAQSTTLTTTSTTTPSAPTHYLVTLLRSTIALPKSIASTTRSLGLNSRLSSSVVPITATTQGAILRVKELVGVRAITLDQLGPSATQVWRDRPGQGRRGSGLRARMTPTVDTIGTPGNGQQPSMGALRVGSERNRGEERGFKVVKRVNGQL